MSVVVCDASALVAALLDVGPDGIWAADQLRYSELAAPHLAPYETANIIRRRELAGLISTDIAAQSHADLLDLDIELWPWEMLARRVWELRHNLTAYDAAYVSLAEQIGAMLITVDARIAGAPGLRCAVATPTR